jgi:hypothetical protein
LGAVVTVVGLLPPLRLVPVLVPVLLPDRFVPSQALLLLLPEPEPEPDAVPSQAALADASGTITANAARAPSM